VSPLLAAALAVWAAMGAVAIAVTIGAGAMRRVRGAADLEALVDATRECAQCTRFLGPCTCAKYCGDICCLAEMEVLRMPSPPRFTGRDSRELS